MIKPARDIIFGVCDKTGTCDSYFGFFKNEDDAKKELKIQSDRLKEDLGLMDLIVKVMLKMIICFANIDMTNLFFL